MIIDNSENRAVSKHDISKKLFPEEESLARDLFGVAQASRLSNPGPDVVIFYKAQISDK